jgi:hypothetical protein
VSGCIACEGIYFPSEIVRWVEGETALCPHCRVNAVMGLASGIPIMPGALRRAHERWFLLAEPGAASRWRYSAQRCFYNPWQSAPGERMYS